MGEVLRDRERWIQWLQALGKVSHTSEAPTEDPVGGYQLAGEDSEEHRLADAVVALHCDALRTTNSQRYAVFAKNQFSSLVNANVFARKEEPVGGYPCAG